MNVSIELTAILGGLIIGLIWFVRLEAKVLNNEKTLNDKIEVLEKKVDRELLRAETQSNKVEKSFIVAIDHLEKALEQSNKNIQDLTIQVAKMMAQLEHKNQRLLDMTARELKDLIDKDS